MRHDASACPRSACRSCRPPACRRSPCAPSASASRISTPACAPRPTPTMIDIGVASPSAQGQAITSTETAAISPRPSRVHTVVGAAKPYELLQRRGLPAPNDRAGYRPDHLQRRGGSDRYRQRLQAGSRLRRLARPRPQAGVRPAIAPSSAESPSVATSTCAPSLCRPPTSSSSGGPPRRGAPCGRGSKKLPSASPIAICWLSRSPTSSRASPGPCSPAAATTNHGAPPMPHEICSLRFTKGMDALPLRHPCSPILLDWVSERRWLRGNGFT